MTIPPPPCGCTVRLNKRGEVNYPVMEYVIDYCNLHANASRLRDALEKILRKATLRGDAHDSIQEVVGRFQNIWKVASDALTSCREKESPADE